MHLKVSPDAFDFMMVLECLINTVGTAQIKTMHSGTRQSNSYPHQFDHSLHDR